MAIGRATAYEPWSLPLVGAADPRLRALSRALLAPSSHNTQPWMVELEGEREIAVYVDPSRRLPQADPHHRQTVISHGAFLEQLDMALRETGWEPVTTLAVDTEPALDGREPLVRVQLSRREPSMDALLAAVPQRHTNKRRYQRGRAVAGETLDRMRRVSWRPGCRLEWITAPALVSDLADLCRQAMAIDVSDRARNEETATWFRFHEREVQAHADGFGIAQGGITGPGRWIAERFFLDRSTAADPAGAFARKAVALCFEQARSASAFGILMTAGNDRAHQLEAGRSYVRAQLAAELAGVRSQPFSQLLQEYPAMTGLRAEMRARYDVPPGWTVQMIFRVGYAAPTPHAPRRPLTALLRHRG
jgi:hypothetical protein